MMPLVPGRIVIASRCCCGEELQCTGIRATSAADMMLSSEGPSQPESLYQYQSMLDPTYEQGSLCKHTIPWYGMHALVWCPKQRSSCGPFTMGSCLNHLGQSVVYRFFIHLANCTCSCRARSGSLCRAWVPRLSHLLSSSRVGGQVQPGMGSCPRALTRLQHPWICLLQLHQETNAQRPQGLK